jgi:hypothetical protein
VELLRKKPIVLDFESKTPRVLEWLYAYIPDGYQHFKNLPQTLNLGSSLIILFFRFPDWVVLP